MCIRDSYQRGEGGVKPSKAEVALRDAVIDRLRESGMDVIADEAEGQSCLLYTSYRTVSCALC